jgi:hypothetical protein
MNRKLIPIIKMFVQPSRARVRKAIRKYNCDGISMNWMYQASSKL